MFNDKYQLTQLVLEGHKTMTRRVENGIIISPKATPELVKFVVEMHKATRAGKTSVKLDDEIAVSIQTRFQIGEEVAIAQSYKALAEKEFMPHYMDDKVCRIIKEGHPGVMNKMYVNPELMPHRIKITDFKVERQRDITDEDCMAEGIRLVLDDRFYYFEEYDEECPCGHYFDTPKEAFEALVQKVMGKAILENNPWVVAYKFELLT